jgi:hypothetical protein
VALQHIKVLRHWVKEPDRRVGETDQETMDIFKRTNKMVSSKKKNIKTKELGRDSYNVLQEAYIQRPYF